MKQLLSIILLSLGAVIPILVQDIIFGTSLKAKAVMKEAAQIAKKAEVKTLQTWDEGRDKKCVYFFEELGEEMPFRVCVPHDWDGKKKFRWSCSCMEVGIPKVPIWMRTTS